MCELIARDAAVLAAARRQSELASPLAHSLLGDDKADATALAVHAEANADADAGTASPAA